MDEGLSEQECLHSKLSIVSKAPTSGRVEAKRDNPSLRITGGMLISISMKLKALKLQQDAGDQQHAGVVGHAADRLEPAPGAADGASAAPEVAQGQARHRSNWLCRRRGGCCRFCVGAHPRRRSRPTASASAASSVGVDARPRRRWRTTESALSPGRVGVGACPRRRWRQPPLALAPGSLGVGASSASSES